MLTCGHCGSELSDILDRCTTCGADVGTPNVRQAQEPAERAALGARYDSAVAAAVGRGAEPAVRAFELAITRTSAVLNCDLDFLREFVSGPSNLYSNYHRGILAETRKAAINDWDRQRASVDSLMFGSYAKEIRFAALTFSDTGLSSYGPYSITLRDVAVARRSSVLDENSYSFVKRHNVVADKPIPKGFRSTWQDRALLAVAKLGDAISSSTTSTEYQNILLSDTGDRAQDRFMEVHIFGTFDREAVECVCGPKPNRPIEVALWEAVKGHLTTLGKNSREL